MSPGAGESLLKKVIVRFRHKSGKNGQVFPQRSWMSGLLIISSQRLILASGPFHHIIPYPDLLSIEDRGDFPLPDTGTVKVIPLVHSSGIDAYLTMVGVTPPMRKRIVRDLYQNILSFYRGHTMIRGGEEVPFYILVGEEGLDLKSNEGETLHLLPEDLSRMNPRTENGSMVFDLGSGEDTSLRFRGKGGKWFKMVCDHYTSGISERISDRYLRVMRYLADYPSTTSVLSANLSMVALEASTVLNELVYLGWVSLDHYSKLFQLTESGREVLKKGDASS